MMSTPRPFRFSTGAFPAVSRSELIALAHKIEDLGYDVAVMPDHFDELMAPALTLLTVAEATSKLRISSYVYDNDFRHPAVLAKEVATLDVLSDGRFEFGIGAGWFESEYRMTGIPFDPPGIRVTRFIESLQLIKRLLSREKVTFKGDYYTITDLQNAPQPVQKPYPPLLIGGGSKRTLSLAAREADIISLIPRAKDGLLDFSENASVESTQQRIQWVREAAGERFDHLELNTLVWLVIVTDQRQQAAEQYAANWNMTAEQMLNSTHFLFGTVDQIVEDVQRWREQFGISYVTVFPEWMDAFAPVIARLAGC
jgi:probable F420-dependent oxidoreductase